MHLLDFEKPIVELESKLDEMREVDAAHPERDLSGEIAKLEARVDDLRKSVYDNLTRWQRVCIARHPDRPYTLDYIGALTSGFVELHGDRLFGDDKAIVGGLGTFCGTRYGGEDQTVFVIGHQKGRDTRQRKERRFGMPNPEGYRKALRLMKMAAKYGKPIITLLDTPGAFPGLEAEERGQAEAIARNLFEMARLPVPIIVVVIGEGASGGALGLGVGDRVLMLENTWYSVISPESCSSILWRSWDYKEEAADALKLTAPDLLETGIIDSVVPEPPGGAHRDPAGIFESVGKALVGQLADLGKLDGPTLIDERLEKFSKMGSFTSLNAVPDPQK